MTEQGKGRVMHDDGFVSTVRYEITSYREFSPSGAPTFIRMKLNLFDRSPEIPLSETAFTLELEDGRTLNFYVRSRGVYEPTGGIKGT